MKGTSKLACLFALFVVSPGHRVRRDDIAHYLWPDGGANAGLISRHLSDLRKSVDVRVGSAGTGVCSMELPRASVDYLRFHELVKQAQTSRGMGALTRFEVLREALKQWTHEEPLLGLPGKGFDLLRSELRQEWCAALIDCLRAAWEAEEIEWILKETEEFLKRFPGNQNEKVFFYRLLATASRSSSEAKKLITERKRTVGKPVDPALAQLFREVTRNTFKPRGISPSRPEHPIPRQLPYAERDIVGRSGELASLRQFLSQRKAEGRGAVILLTGMAGVGKSALANHLCRMVEADFPEGTLYANLTGFAGEGTSPAEPGRVLGRFLSDLGVRADTADIDAMSGAFRSRLATRSVVMVLDDAAHAGQVLPLLPGTGSSVAIITSRNQLPDLSAHKDVRVFRIEPLDRESAAEVLSTQMTPDTRRRCGPSVDKLAELCGRLPLALAVIAGQIRGRPAQGVAELVVRLSQEHQRLKELRGPDDSLSVRLALDCSVATLSAQAGCLLRQLALHPGPSIDWAATMDLGSVGVGGDTERAVTELVDANLLELAADRYRLHDLVRAYARHDMAPGADDPDGQLEERTIRQILEHQLQNLAACDRVIDPQRSLPIEEPRGLRVVDPVTEEAAMAYLDAEYEALLQGIDLALRGGHRRYVWLLSMALVSYQWRRNRHAEAERQLRNAEEASRGLASPADRAMVYRMLAGSQIRAGHLELGLGNADIAVRLSRQQADAAGRLSLAFSLHLRAVGHERRVDLQAAEEGHRSALELFDDLGNVAGAAAALNGIGTVHHARGAFDEALRTCGEALRIFETVDDANGRANVITTLAEIHLSRLERDEALRLYERAVAIYRELSYWPNEAKILGRYADALLSAGNVERAVKALERVAVLCEFMGDERGLRRVMDRLEGMR
ncbi:tetratricopeptide repeat protein [Streptomyces sp. NPDC052020]|uniref:AfsR/SARP family transcriptional regulator n=1 Tax=Streptomyces sp. NPDC052020 TaxID=3155677 RepID=UPI0034207150